ncbi:hypothetical protein ACQZV8_13400 [Magnetococcales bacterium HHB-1]
MNSPSLQNMAQLTPEELAALNEKHPPQQHQEKTENARALPLSARRKNASCSKRNSASG